MLEKVLLVIVFNLVIGMVECFMMWKDLQQRTINKIGLQRCGQIEELVRTINFIVDTEYVAGTNLKIDGGM